MLVLVGEVGMQAGLHSDGTLLLKNMRHAWSSELASLFYIARASGASGRAVLLLLAEWRGARAAPALQLACTRTPAWP